MKTTAVLIIAGILLSFVTLKLVIPLFFLYRGFGTEVTLPSWLVRALPPRATIYLSLSCGPLLFALIVLATWFLLRH